MTWPPRRPIPPSKIYPIVASVTVRDPRLFRFLMSNPCSRGPLCIALANNGRADPWPMPPDDEP